MLRVIPSAVLSLALSCTPAGDDVQRPQQPPVNANAAVLSDFTKRVDAYVTLHRNVESSLPPLKDQTTPELIDKHQRALEQLIRDARRDAKPGDLFAPPMQKLVRELLRPIFAGPGGAEIKAEILDNEYKGQVKLVVNGRYPDEIPISTVPPQVLAQLPKLPEELEYRFIQNSLILFDPHAHVIADYIPNAF